MADAWKREELKVSKLLPGSQGRRLMKGSGEIEDIIHDRYDIDVKLRSRLRVQEWWNKLSQDAQTKGKTPILVFRRPKVSRLRLAAIDIEFGMKIYNHFGGPNLFYSDDHINQHWSIETWFRGLQKEARARNKIPFLCVQHPDSLRKLVIMSFDNLVSALKGMDGVAGATDGNEEATGGP